MSACVHCLGRATLPSVSTFSPLCFESLLLWFPCALQRFNDKNALVGDKAHTPPHSPSSLLVAAWVLQVSIMMWLPCLSQVLNPLLNQLAL